MNEHNGRPIRQVAPGWFELADFTGRYTQVQAPDAAAAVAKFVEARTCNYDVSYAVRATWEAHGCPDRARWLELTGCAS